MHLVYILYISRQKHRQIAVKLPDCRLRTSGPESTLKKGTECENEEKRLEERQEPRGY